jgi:hypothetical protein
VTKHGLRYTRALPPVFQSSGHNEYVNFENFLELHVKANAVATAKEYRNSIKSGSTKEQE